MSNILNRAGRASRDVSSLFAAGRAIYNTAADLLGRGATSRIPKGFNYLARHLVNGAKRGRDAVDGFQDWAQGRSSGGPLPKKRKMARRYRPRMVRKRYKRCRGGMTRKGFRKSTKVVWGGDKSAVRGGVNFGTPLS